jgi:hypothetical protein
MTRGRVFAALMPVAAAMIAGCGGGDDPVVQGPGAKEAEATAREFLLAGVEGDAEKACGLLTSAYRNVMERTIPCENLVDFQSDQAKQGKAEFDDEPIEASSIENLELQASVAEDGQTATVTGAAGTQSISLQLLNGKWAISAFSGPGQSG